MSGYTYSINLMLSMVLILLSRKQMQGFGHNINEEDDDYECGGHRCGRHGPRIRFPFRLKDKEPPHCGYPGFDLSCNEHLTLLEIPADPAPITFHVTDIDYESTNFGVSDPDNCLPIRFLKLNYTSISPFQFDPWGDHDQNNIISFFNCSPDAQPQFSCPIYAADDGNRILDTDLLSCTKMFNISSTLFDSWDLNSNDLTLWWSKPNCSECETKGKQCKLKNRGSELLGEEVECFLRHHKPVNRVLLGATGVGVGSILLVLLMVTASFKIFHYFRLKEEDRARIEKFLEDYRAHKPTRFSYADIKRITNGLKEKLGEGSHGAVFKGMLSSQILVAVKILNNTENEGKDFTNEVGTMGKIHHVNVVRLLGFCAEGFHRALVYDFFPKGSLQNFISTPDNIDIFLGWEKLHQVAIGVARGIEYLHQGCEQQILHFDINPHNVLLDDKFTPKITDFGLAKLCSRNQSGVSMTAARGTLGYIAPEVVSRNFGKVSNKSDIYSYGMLLLEMVGGRKNVEMAVERPLQVLYPEWVHNLLDGEDTHILIGDEEDLKIAKKIAIVGLWCIQWHPVDRPSIKTVLQMLEGDGDQLTVPHNPYHSTSSTTSETTIVRRRLNFELEMIEE